MKKASGATLFQTHFFRDSTKRPLIISVVTLFGIFVLLSQAPFKMSSAATNNKKSFSLLVALQFQDVSTKTEFLQAIEPLVNYVRDHEPTTIGYEVLMSDKNDLKALILERYMDKEDAYLKIHKSSAEFLSFRPKLQALVDAGRVTISGESYEDAGVGFVGRN